MEGASQRLVNGQSVSVDHSAQIGSSGKDSVIASAGLDAKAKVGKNGAIALTYKDAKGRYRIAVGYEGEGLTADMWYRVDGKGKFVEAK